MFGNALADVLARHVKVTGIDDVLTFYSTCEDEIRAARSSIWLWAWVLNRVRSIPPLLRERVGRSVRVTVFIRDSADQAQAVRLRPLRRGTSIELRRLENGTSYWRCEHTVCNTRPNGRRCAWDQDIR
ncbi:hypothetical protein AB0907_38485 [Streptomyces sp. NPDC006975]|uniref:hypothetical protein n=1 Tax=Streptomyces sp. NPDC006975 TaxID=3154310 RepID=UPI003456C754